ncbi:protein FAR1-RELATED SEQUENCE 8-like [Salvia divinorum]|uniref:Protein FAR1-RELATED SEQUENCE 8-like n=1 Tax=Salvia divinorum TaxID=28513 RepID=A0ABD1I2Y7_SALDI
MGPMPRMEYDSKDIFLTAYRHYAKLKGFSISIRNSSSKYYVLACSKGRKSKNVKKFTKQTQCPARANSVLKDNDKLVVTCVESNHNHTLEPQLSMFIPGYRTS